MRRNEILTCRGTDYKEMTKRLLARAELAQDIPSLSAKIGIKPNLVTPTPAAFGATTHPEVVEGILEYLQENGFSDITILEGSWVGDRTAEAFDCCGYHTLAERFSVKLLDTQKDKSVKKDCAGMSLSVCRSVLDLDYLINVPVLKGHCQTKITCALKNLKGVIPNAEKRRFHSMGLHKPIAHLNAAIRQDFIVVDHICGDPDFEEGGNPRQTDCILAAKDPVLADAYACRELGLSPEDIVYIRLAEALGVGCADLSALKLIPLPDGSGHLPETSPEPAAGRRVLDVCYAVDEVDSCSACYGSLIPALARLKEEGLLPLLSEKIAIGQGHRGKTGKLGVGNCTRDFCFSVAGCPPSEEEMYAGLKAFILSRQS